jgi:hypothetical protein
MNDATILARFRESWSFDIDEATVAEFRRSGSVEPSSIGDDYDDALTDALQDTFDTLGVEVGS